MSGGLDRGALGSLGSGASSVSTHTGLPGLPATPYVAQPFGTAAIPAGGLTTRCVFQAAYDCTDLRLVYAGWYQDSTGEHNMPNQITVKVTVEVNSTTYPVTFGGVQSLTIDPGGTAVSDPLGFELLQGDAFYVRTFTTVPGGTGSYYQGVFSGGHVLYAGGVSAGTGFSSGSDTSGSTGSLSGGSFKQMGPVAVQATPLGTTVPASVVGVGDSIVAGTGDTNNAGGGFLARGLGVSRPFQVVGTPSLKAQSVADRYGHHLTSRLWSTAKHAVVLLGTNDFQAATAAVTIEGYLTTVYTALKNRGLTVWGVTMPPKTTSTDSWATTVNQTISANEAIRTTVNAWIRTTPSPLAGFFELADQVETARDSGLWKVSNTSDGIHPNATGAAAGAAAVNTAVLV